MNNSYLARYLFIILIIGMINTVSSAQNKFQRGVGEEEAELGA